MALGGISRSVQTLLGQIQRCRLIVSTNHTGKFVYFHNSYWCETAKASVFRYIVICVVLVEGDLTIRTTCLIFTLLPVVLFCGVHVFK